jgi:hypothetical protein
MCSALLWQHADANAVVNSIIRQQKNGTHIKVPPSIRPHLIDFPGKF